MGEEGTAIISGANGFVGSHIRHYLNSIGWKVLSSGRHFNDDFYFDLSQPVEFSNLTIDIKVDAFIHVAAAHEVACKNDPYEAISLNILGTKSALAFSVSNRIPKFVYISTFHVFGNPSGDITEDTIPNPVSEYGLSHYYAEQYVEMYHRNGFLRGVSLRPSNIYGVPLDLSSFGRWSLIPYAFCKEAVEKNSITLLSSGIQQRNFVAISDVCNTIGRILEIDNFPPVIHVLSGQNFSVKEFSFMVRDILHKDFDHVVDVIIGKEKISERTYSFKSGYSDFYLKNRSSPLLSTFVRNFCDILLKDRL